MILLRKAGKNFDFNFNMEFFPARIYIVDRRSTTNSANQEIQLKLKSKTPRIRILIVGKESRIFANDDNITRVIIGYLWMKLILHPLFNIS